AGDEIAVRPPRPVARHRVEYLDAHRLRFGAAPRADVDPEVLDARRCVARRASAPEVDAAHADHAGQAAAPRVDHDALPLVELRPERIPGQADGIVQTQIAVRREAAHDERRLVERARDDAARAAA